MQEDLESEFSSLYAVLDEQKESMVTSIKRERASRIYELQVRVFMSMRLRNREEPPYKSEVGTVTKDKNRIELNKIKLNLYCHPTKYDEIGCSPFSAN